MRRFLGGVSIIDFLIIMAILLIVAGMLGPFFPKRSVKSSGVPATSPVHSERPLR